MRDPTPYPELNAVLRQLVDGVRDTLGNTLVGAYLQGSFAVGGFDEHSDVDFVIAVRGELSTHFVEQLQALHGRVYDFDSEWAKHLEGSYFPMDVLRSHERRQELLWYLGHGARFLVRSTHCNTVVVRWVVREHGVALAGADPATLVAPVPVAALRSEILSTIVDWGEEILAHPEPFRNRFYQSFIVLSYCRMLHDLVKGRVSSKRKGADWAKNVMEASWHGLIDRSWNGRPDPAVSSQEPPDDAEFGRTLQFVRFVMGEARCYAGRDLAVTSDLGKP